MNGLVLALDAGNIKSYNATGTVYSTGWSGSFINASSSFDGNLTTGTSGSASNSTFTYTFAGGLSVSGTVRVYVTFGATSGQVAGLTNVILVDGTDISSKMAAANLYFGSSPGSGWIDVTTEVGSTFNTIVLTSTSGRANPSISAIEVNGQILVDATFIWTDLSGNGNRGILTNGPTYSSANGGSIVFDGVDDYVTLGTPSSLNITASITVNSWVKLSSFPSSGNFVTIYEKGYDGTNEQTYFRISGNSSSIQFGTYNASASDKLTQYVVSSSVLVNNWCNIVGVFDGSNFSIYLNNVLVSQTSYVGSLFGSSSPVSIGAASISGTYQKFLNGGISVVQVYNRALTAAEISQNFNATRSRYGI